MFRSVQGCISITLTYYCLSIFPVSTVGITNALQPLLTVLLACMFLGENLGAFDVVSLLLATASAGLVVSGIESEQPE